VNIRASVTTRMVSAHVCLAGRVPIAIKLVQRTLMAQVALSVVVVKTISIVARMMDTAFVCPAGWEITAPTFALRVSTGNTACIPAPALHPISNAMRLKVVSVAVATWARIVIN